MRRRTYLAVAGSAIAGSTSGCLGESKIQKIDDFARIEPESGNVWQIPGVDEADDTVEVGYDVQSETLPFQVFYFRSSTNAELYRQYIDGEEPGTEPTGVDPLKSTADPNEQGVFKASATDDGAREEIKIDGEKIHHFVLDCSNYGQYLGVEKYDENLEATVDLVVRDPGML